MRTVKGAEASAESKYLQVGGKRAAWRPFRRGAALPAVTPAYLDPVPGSLLAILRIEVAGSC